MRQRIFQEMACLAIFSICMTITLAAIICYPLFLKQMQEEIRLEASYVIYGMQNSPSHIHYLQNLSSETRITLINESGKVLFDNIANADTMENHAYRPEIIEANKTGVSESSRLSSTFDAQTFYYAKKLNDNTIIRFSRTNNSLGIIMLQAFPAIIIIMFIICALSLFFAKRMSKNIIRPINKLNLHDPLNNEDVYDELSPLLHRLDKQNHKIADQLAQLQAQQRDFAVMTENMNEGLILLNDHLKILSVNQSAMSSLTIHSDIDYIGKDLVVFNHDLILKNCADTALKGIRTETYLKRDDSVYQLIASPVYDNDTPKGALILLIDVTEKHHAEQLRREFSANVSHELKTPLTSISGFAELMKNKMVPPEDSPIFAEKIYQEAQRMITLIANIIKISRLDESNIHEHFEQLPISDMCNSIIDRLKNKAAEKNIQIIAQLKPDAEIFAVKILLEELIYNLIDNAIKYTKTNGQINVSIECDAANHIVFTVKDNGIGIPKAEQKRIFERFYRVDKSRSREMGSNGLGLSIVKHVIEYHHAKISLESQENVGTTFIVTFPNSEI